MMAIQMLLQSSESIVAIQFHPVISHQPMSFSFIFTQMVQLQELDSELNTTHQVISILSMLNQDYIKVCTMYSYFLIAGANMTSIFVSTTSTIASTSAVSTTTLFDVQGRLCKIICHLRVCIKLTLSNSLI